MRPRWLSRRIVIAAALVVSILASTTAVMTADRKGRLEWKSRYDGRKHRLWFISWRRVQVIVGNPRDDDWRQLLINVK